MLSHREALAGEAIDREEIVLPKQLGEFALCKGRRAISIAHTMPSRSGFCVKLSRRSCNAVNRAHTALDESSVEQVGLGQSERLRATQPRVLHNLRVYVAALPAVALRECALAVSAGSTAIRPCNRTIEAALESHNITIDQTRSVLKCVFDACTTVR